MGMSCRKYEAPRHGSLAYCPKRRASTLIQPIGSNPVDNQSEKVHPVGFIGYKAGMTHTITVSTRVLRVDRKSRDPKREELDAVTIIECPDVTVFGITGYSKSVTGLKKIGTVFSKQIDESCKARYVKRYSRSSKAAFRSYEKKYENGEIENELLNLEHNADVIRLIVHTSVPKACKTKRAHILELQLNGGNIQEKMDFAKSKLGGSLSVKEVFDKDELLDIIGVTKGKGFTGVIKRFGVRIQPRKSRKGKRKVACIGAWHPANVMRTVARAGHMGFHRRTMPNKKVYMIAGGSDILNTEFDLTKKTINPMGGFPNYGDVKSTFLMVKGNVMGPCKRAVTLRKTLVKTKKEKNLEKTVIKFVDTTSKRGHGRFQTKEEKRAFYGLDKKEVEDGI